MKRFVSGILAATLLASPAFAGSSSQSSSNSNAQSVAVNNFNTPSHTKSTVRTTTTVAVAGLAASINSCAGSATGGVSIPGINAVLGGTFAMRGCEIRAKATALQALGQNAAALAVLCKDKDIQEALEVTGGRCPKPARRTVAVVETSSR